MLALTHPHPHAYTHIHTHRYTNKHAHVHVYTCTHAHLHACMNNLSATKNSLVGNFENNNYYIYRIQTMSSKDNMKCHVLKYMKTI